MNKSQVRSKRKHRGLDDSVVLKRSPKLHWSSRPDGSITIMHLGQFDHFVTVDKIAAKIWSMIDGKTSAGKIREKIARRYHTPKGVLERDFEKYIRRLRSLGLLVE